MDIINLVKKALIGLVLLAITVGAVFAGSALAALIWAGMWVLGGLVVFYALLMVHNYLTTYLARRGSR